MSGRKNSTVLSYFMLVEYILAWSCPASRCVGYTCYTGHTRRTTGCMPHRRAPLSPPPLHHIPMCPWPCSWLSAVLNCAASWDGYRKQKCGEPGESGSCYRQSHEGSNSQTGALGSQLVPCAPPHVAHQLDSPLLAHSRVGCNQ